MRNFVKEIGGGFHRSKTAMPPYTQHERSNVHTDPGHLTREKTVLSVNP